MLSFSKGRLVARHADLYSNDKNRLCLQSGGDYQPTAGGIPCTDMRPRQRQAKRLRAETEATACSTIAPQMSDSRGYSVKSLREPKRASALFSLESKNRFSFRAIAEKKDGGAHLRSLRILSTRKKNSKNQNSIPSMRLHSVSLS